MLWPPILSRSPALIPPPATVFLCFLLWSCPSLPTSCRGFHSPHHHQLLPADLSSLWVPGHGCCFLGGVQSSGSHQSAAGCLLCGPHPSIQHLSCSVLKALLAFVSHLLPGRDISRSSSVQKAAERPHLSSGWFTGSSTGLGTFPVNPTLFPAPGFLCHSLQHGLPSRLSPVISARAAENHYNFLNF